MLKTWTNLLTYKKTYQKPFAAKKIAIAEISYWRYKAQQLAVKNKDCLNCLTETNKDNPYCVETMTCAKCEGPLRDWEKTRGSQPADHFWKHEALKRQQKMLH